MRRMLPSLIAIAAASIAAPVFAADWEDDGFRDSYASDESGWNVPGDTFNFEAGLRYWYSMGDSTFSDGTGTDASSTDTTHILEGHLRISDDFTRTNVTMMAGYSVAINGDYDNSLGTGTFGSGHIGYAGADFGVMLLGDNVNGIGPTAGYLYWNDALETTRQNFTVATSAADIGFDPNTGATAIPMDSEPDNLHINAAKLGIGAHVGLGDRVSLAAQASVIPYANIQGTLGSAGPGIISLTPLGNIGRIGASAATVNGWAYGGSAEVTLGFEPIKNVSFSIGGRAMFLQGWTDATYTVATIGDPGDSDGANPPNYDTPPAFATQGIISTGNPFSMMRYGLLAGVSYKF